MLAREITRLGRNVLIYGGGDALVRFISFLLLPVFTRYLTPDDYGVRGLLLALAAVLSPVFSLGLSAAVGPCYFEGNNLRRKAATIWTAGFLLLASSTIMLIAGTVFSPAICRGVFQSEQYVGLLRLTLWTAAAAILSEPFNVYLRFEEKARLVVAISVCSALVTVGSSILLVVVFRQGVLGLVLAALIGQVAMLAMQAGPALLGLPIRWTRSLVKPLLVLGVPLIPSFAWLYIIQQAGKYLLQWRCGLETVGLYQIGLSVAGFAGPAVSAFQSAWYPFFMSFLERQADAGRVFSRVFTYYVFGACFLTAGFFACAKPVLAVMTQPAFHAAYRVVGLTAAGMLAQGLFYLLLPPMYFAREIQAVTLIQGAVAALAFLANFFMIRLWGMMGAASAFFLSFALFVPLTLAWNRFRGGRYLAVPYEIRRPALAMLATAGLATLSLAKPAWALPGEFIFAGAGVLAIALCILALMTESERALILGFVRHRAPVGAAGGAPGAGGDGHE